MLGDVALVVPTNPRKPLWLYPNLLSLDAPIVAVAWLHVFAMSWRLYLPWIVYLALALAVWSIYVADRLLDVSMMAGNTTNMQPRHVFHQNHRKSLVIGLVIAVSITITLVVTMMPMAIFKYMFFGGVLVAGFFGLSMISTQNSQEVAYTKNIIAGFTFAFGTAVVAHMYRYEFAIDAMLRSPEFLCFAVLCILNISAIDLWEHTAKSTDAETNAYHELALTLPLILLGAASLGLALLGEDSRPGEFSTRPFFYATLTGAALLYALNRMRDRFQLDTLRVLADVALLIPVLIFISASNA